MGKSAFKKPRKKKRRIPASTVCSGGPADLVRKISPKDDARHPPGKDERVNARTVQGFGVREQTRRKFRDDFLAGTHEGHDWVVYSEGDGLFRWDLAGLNGFSGPTLADALRSMKKAVAVRAKIVDQYGAISDEQLRGIQLLLRWEHRLSQGRLMISGPHGEGEYRVLEVKP